MATKIFLIIAFLAVANAGYKWVDDDEDDAPPGFHRMWVPPLMQPPPLPNIPGLPKPPPLMAPPPLFAPNFGHHFPHFVHTPFINMPEIPKPGDIKKIKPGPGQVFNGVSVRSHSGYAKDKDGKEIKIGGSTVVINDNGEVHETKVGKNPPKIDDPIVMPTFPLFQKIKMPKFEPFKPFVFEPITFKPFIFKPITFKPIDVNHKPGEGETFVAFSHSEHSESSDNNGVKSSSGGSNTVVNDNGDVNQQGVEFEAGDDGSKKTK